jgi:heterodisulfide reductase subunit B
MSPERYTYYPGCSAKGVGRAYEESLLAVFEHLGAGLDELEDWNCCGATAWASVDEDQAFALAARNLALTEDRSPGGGPIDLVAACTGCYRALVKAEHALGEPGPTAAKVGGALASIGLDYEGRARIRHPLDILVNEIGLDAIASAVVRPLTGLRVASYYGCLLVRPFSTFDDQWNPTSMDRLVAAIGAEPIDWPLKTRCCGGSCYCGGPVIGVMPEATMQLSHALIREAKARDADLIVTVCPLCQFNLEGFQDRMTRKFGHPHDMSVAFISQLVGVALGIDDQALGIHRLLRWKLPEREPAPAEGGVHARA